MLRIETDSDECVTILRLSGRIQSDHIGSIRSALSGSCARKVLDLSEVTLVDVVAVQYLAACEEEGIELSGCPPYIREWIARERAEGAGSIIHQSR
jgi:anti-anti-sigma regulatory factor